MIKFEHLHIPLSKRGYIFFLEHSKIRMENGILVYSKAESGFLKSYNIPYLNCSIVILGEGTSVTRDAVDTISDSGCLIMFVGGKGLPLHASSSESFTLIEPSNEYRPNEYMQSWVKIWFNEDERLMAARQMCNLRINNVITIYQKLPFVKEMNIEINENTSLIQNFRNKIKVSQSENDLLVAEAVFTKKLYSLFSSALKWNGFTREHQISGNKNDFDITNNYLNHGNYLFYGMASIALNGLGISYSFPLLHGKTRRGALVFDVADLFKDSLCLPLAFYCAYSGMNEKEFRSKFIFYIYKNKILDKMFEQVKSIALGEYNA